MVVAGVVFFIVLALLCTLAQRCPIKKWTAFVALIAVFLYLLLWVRQSNTSPPASVSRPTCFACCWPGLHLRVDLARAGIVHYHLAADAPCSPPVCQENEMTRTT
jgi:hypothetical protein